MADTELQEEAADLEGVAASFAGYDTSESHRKYLLQREYNVSTGRRMKDELIRRRKPKQDEEPPVAKGDVVAKDARGPDGVLRSLRRAPCSPGRVLEPAAEEAEMERQLNGKRVAILVADGFEQVELTEPRTALEQAGAKTTLISSAERKVKGWNRTNWGDEFAVDLPLKQARAEDFDALLLPGGVMNPDKLRLQPDAVRLTQDFFRARKPVAAICHGPWLLVEADVIRGRTVTSYPSIQTDLENAGAKWVDREVVVDEGLVTSRMPDDIPAFNRKMIEEIAEGVHTGPRA